MADGSIPQSIDLACLHCGAPAPSGKPYCCKGCEAVASLLAAEGLERYYALGGGRGSTVTTWGKTLDHKWLERIALERATTRGITQLALDVQGIHCAACVWLFEELFRREPGGVAVTVNPALGRMDLTVSSDFPIGHYVESIERFGYVVGPALKRDDDAPTSDLLVRTGACIAIAMNAMIFAVAIYAGLDSGPIFRFFHGITFGLATLSVLIGGTVFFRSAWQSLRARVLHLDVPIALGIVLAYSGSAYSVFARRGDAAYFDTVSVFIALMLVGRFLQERVLERNRRQLLASDGVDTLLTRVIGDGGTPAIVPCKEIEAGTRLLVAPSDLVPVSATLESNAASISLDWINGESAPREAREGEVVPAGAFNVGREAVIMRAREAFATSPIVELLRTPRRADADTARATAWWRTFTKYYVVTVLLLAAGAFTSWVVVTHDVARALEVTTALLVITCPCAFGIATPMAYELVQAGLRRAGVFVRSASFLDRAVAIRRVVFDKTGTLTTGALTVTNPAAIDALLAIDRAALFDLTARSTHPKSAAIARLLAEGGARLDEKAVVTELAGAGLVLERRGITYRLGSSAHVGDVASPTDDVVFTREERGHAPEVLARIALDETLRDDARGEVRALAKAGFEVSILSGDARGRVEVIAESIGIPRERAVGDCSPRAKADWLAAHDHEDTLMVGDGLNDGLAAEQAFASATPAIDRPFMPARTDFYFTSAGLRPVRLALVAAHRLQAVTQRNLVVAIAYNVVTVSLSYAGLMSPLICAVVMPVSSLSIVLATLVSLSPRSALWRS